MVYRKTILSYYLLHCLWRGEVDNAMNIIEQIEVSDTRKKWKKELSAYLEKHRPEIINYEKRKGIGKSIGSGRVENGVKQTAGQRQKHKGMSWSKAGSKSLNGKFLSYNVILFRVEQINNCHTQKQKVGSPCTDKRWQHSGITKRC